MMDSKPGTDDRCRRCILPTTFPGVSYNQEGICSLCSSYVPPSPPLGKVALLKEIPAGDGPSYDCVVPVSGGKDSSYVLYYAVKELKLRVIAANYNSGFQSQQARENIRHACETLHVPLEIYNADFQNRRALLKEVIRIANIAGVPFGVCGNCETSIRAFATHVARVHGVRTILLGDSQAESVARSPFAGLRGLLKRTSPTEALKLSIPVVRYAVVAARERAMLGLPLRYAYTLSMTPIPYPNAGIKVVHFFDFIRWETMDKASLLDRELGWKAPCEKVDRFDCLLHPLDNYKWLREAGITKDGVIYCNMVRAGTITREEAMHREEVLTTSVRQECAEFARRFEFEGLGLKWLQPTSRVSS